MKNPIIASLIIGLCMLFVMQIAFADVMKINIAIQKLHDKGYKNIHEIEFKDGFYKAKVFTAEGNKLELRVNTKTGEIENPKGNPKFLSLLDVVKKVEAEGYRDISKISFDEDEYEVAAKDKEGNNVKLEVDAKTGKIEKAWF